MNDTTAKRLPVPLHYLLMADVLHMSLVAIVLCLVLFTGTEVPFTLQLVITALVMVVMLRGGSWLVLGAMQVSMYFYESRAGSARLDLPIIVNAVLCLAMIAYAAGFRSIRSLLREWIGRLLYLLMIDPPKPGEQNVLASLDARRDHIESWTMLREQSLMVIIRAARLLAIVLAASIVFLQLPITRPAITAWWQRSVADGNQLWPGPTGFILAIVCLLVISIGSWRRLSELQARLYLKSDYVREHFRELRSVLVRGGYLSERPMVMQPAKPAKTVREK